METKHQRKAGTVGPPGAAIRRASWFFVMALSAAWAIPLDAEVIDDFEDGVKYAVGGGGMDYFTWGVTGGQLVVSRSVPVPTPIDDEALTYDNVYWPTSTLPAGTLEGGRTLELRTDLVHASADDLFLLLMSGGQNLGADSAYAALVDRNEVALMKYRDGGNLAIFFWDTLQNEFENVTVRLAFRKTTSGLEITVQVLNKANPEATPYTKSFTDGPGRDDPVPAPDPHTIGDWTADEGAPYTNITYTAVGVWQIIRTSPPSLEMRLDNLEYDVYNAPKIDSVRLAWSANMVEEQIVVGASSLAGDAAWRPWPEPIYNRFGSPSVSVCPGDGVQFFKLVPGSQFIDDFDPPKLPYVSKADWTPYFYTSSDSGRFEIANTGNALRIRTLTTPIDSRVIILPPGPDIVVRDFFASVDLLEMTGAVADEGIAIAARGWRDPDRPFPGQSSAYMGGVVLNPPGSARLFVFDGEHLDTAGPLFELAPTADYRLQFSGVGNDLTVRLVNLTDPQAPVQERRKIGTISQQGLVGLWGQAMSPSYAFTLDNFLVTGTKP